MGFPSSERKKSACLFSEADAHFDGYSVSLYQPDQQLVDVLCGLAASQQLVPKGQHRARQQPALSACQRQDDLLSPEHHTSPTQTKR